jgi:hypothetical protein
MHHPFRAAPTSLLVLMPSPQSRRTPENPLQKTQHASPVFLRSPQQTETKSLNTMQKSTPTLGRCVTRASSPPNAQKTRILPRQRTAAPVARCVTRFSGFPHNTQKPSPLYVASRPFPPFPRCVTLPTAPPSAHPCQNPFLDEIRNRY